ncbi:MAG: betaine-aldehyde dehydrogenase [Hellea sp.]
MAIIPDTSHFIHGRYVAGGGAGQFPAINPATGETLTLIEQASQTEIDAVIESAKKGFAVWSKMTGTQRSRIMMKAVALLRERNQELAELEVLDTGKPIQEAEAVDIVSGADSIEYFAGLAPSLHGEHVDLSSAFFYTRREPLGICAGIGAWNYPIQIACWKSAPALACGNVMIFKPSEETPLSALKLAEIYTEAGLPDGVFNVIQGDRRVGQALVEHPDIAKVSITGEVGTGKKIMAAAAKTLKHVTMELGGKSPLIIFDDSDLENAVSAALMANFYTQGEICSNGTRVYVQSGIYDAFLARLKTRTEAMIIGDPMHPDTHMGSLIHKAHMDQVMDYIRLGKSEGARLVTGGERVTVKGFEAGNFVQPTVFAECNSGMRIVREEIFGPVMAVIPFDDEDAVIAEANDTTMGLAAGIFTRDIKRAHRVVAQLQAGTCWINNYNITPSEMPFGGYKQSGLGRENGRAAIEHYTQIKSVYVELGDVDAPY